MLTKTEWSAFLVLVLCFINCQGQEGKRLYHLLKYINTNEDDVPPRPPQYSSSVMDLSNSRYTNTMSNFANADRICLDGMWALYNTTSFGQGAEDSTTVISVRGTDVTKCTRPGQIPVLRSIQSLRYLGNAEYSQDGLYIFSQAYLLGASWNVGGLQALPEQINGFPLGSLAVTGNSNWLLCADNQTPCQRGVCINMKNTNLYLQRNTLKDASLPNGWPRVVRAVSKVNNEDCSYFPNPRVTNRKLKRRAIGDDDEEDIEVNIWSP